MFPSEAIQVLERSPSRVVILEPPYYSMGIWLFFLALLFGAAAAFLFYKGFLPALGIMFGLVVLGLGVFGTYLMTSKRLITVSRADGLLEVRTSSFGRTRVEGTLALDQVRKVVVENNRYANSLVVVKKSGEALSLDNGTNREGYYGAAEAINELLGP
jgi:hypothetical protein